MGRIIPSFRIALEFENDAMVLSSYDQHREVRGREEGSNFQGKEL
jgi:hypothetical protein